MSTPDEALECLEGHDGTCKGSIELRWPLSGTGRSFPRCEKHWDERVEKQEELNRRYGHPDSNMGAPADFDPSYAGEAWGEDDY